MRFSISVAALFAALWLTLANAVAGLSHGVSSLPLVPLHYVETRTGNCRFELPAQNEGLALQLAPLCGDGLFHIVRQLGGPSRKLEAPVLVRVVADPQDMGTLAPAGAAPPSWSQAVAYPEHNLILLALHNRQGAPVEDLDIVLAHELSHLVLHREIGNRPLPRWLTEGIAIQQSEHSSYGRYWVLLEAALFDKLLPLQSIERYPDSHGAVNVAYAEAADFVGFLIRKAGWSGMREMLRLLVRGEPFEDAFAMVYRDSVRGAERQWRQALAERGRLLPLFTGSGLVWGIAAALFVVAYLAVRRRRKRRLAQMQLEEQREDLAITEGAPAQMTLVSSPNEHVPRAHRTKVRWEDDIHTLH